MSDDTTPRRRGRPAGRDYPETMLLRLPAGSLARLQAVLTEGETQADLARAAVLSDIARREQA